jgi:DNA-binding CsgD family transcriptional regulator
VYRALKNTDSFYRYSQLSTELADSLKHILYLSNSNIAQIRINNERNRFAIKALQSEKRSIIQKRNFLIAAVSFLAIIIIIILDRQKKILKYRQQLVLKEKEKTDAEVLAAREQLNIFTQSLVEKTILLDKMQQQLSETVLSREQQKIINDLTHHTILTEDDWTKFKSLFEHIYPGFFSKLRQKAKDITLAEQRMAALTRLHLTAKEMASMLGISPDSVHKTKHRLRQRLQISTENSMDEFISGL